MKTRTRNMMNIQLPNDIGVMPGTFIRPPWKDLPSVFENPKDRWLMEWTWLKTRVQNFMR